MIRAAALQLVGDLRPDHFSCRVASANCGQIVSSLAIFCIFDEGYVMQHTWRGCELASPWRNRRFHHIVVEVVLWNRFVRIRMISMVGILPCERKHLPFPARAASTTCFGRKEQYPRLCDLLSASRATPSCSNCAPQPSHDWRSRPILDTAYWQLYKALQQHRDSEYEAGRNHK